jgi:hypothetical protein
MDRTQLRYLLNSGPSRVLDIRKMRFEQELDPIFKIAKLNGAILLKQSSLESAESGPGAPIVTRVFLPYDRKRPEEGGESFLFTAAGLREAMNNVLGERNIKQEDIAADTHLLTLFDRVPSFSPYLIRDVVERAGVSIPDGYFCVPEREAVMIKQRMRARLRPLVANAFGGGRKTISETSIERLVQKLWELKDLEELQPLIEAFGIPFDQAGEVFYCWLGIAFFENEYLKLQPRLKKMAAWMSTRSATRELLPRAILDHYNHSVGYVRKLLQAHWKKALSILQDYTSTYEELIAANSSAARFIEFLRQSKAHFWTLGGCLGRLEQSVEIWEQICSRYDYGTLVYERANELFSALTLINAQGSVATESPAILDAAS